MEIPKAIKDSGCVFVGFFKDRRVFAQPATEDVGAGTGYPFVYLLNKDGDFEFLNVANNPELFDFLNKHA